MRLDDTTHARRICGELLASHGLFFEDGPAVQVVFRDHNLETYWLNRAMAETAGKIRRGDGTKRQQAIGDALAKLKAIPEKQRVVDVRDEGAED